MQINLIKKKSLKVQMPGGLPGGGGMLNFRIDRRITRMIFDRSYCDVEVRCLGQFVTSALKMCAMMAM